MKYRKEVDGLRALAVIPILLFHAHPALLPGGFLGVDVFFVISGYLISSLILQESQEGAFKFSRFYERRARRILPALIAVMFTSLAIGSAFLLPDDLENLGQSVVATSLFSNNILLYLTSGYWDLEVQLKPLVHTWSLGVEEQFYIFAPLILLSIRRRWLFGALSLLCLLSLSFSIWYFSVQAEFVFLMIFSRAWELAIGSLLAISPRPSRFSGFWGTLGLLMLVSSFFLFQETTPHPGFRTLLPTLGTAFILLGANPGNWVGRFFSLTPIVWTGLLSYSLYLWHQPMLAFLRLGSLQEPTPLQSFATAFAAFIPAYISYRFIEKPFRSLKTVSSPKFFGILTISITILLCWGAYLHYTSGRIGAKPEWASDNWATSTNASYNEEAKQYIGEQFENTDGKTKLLIVGDSYARDVIHMIEESGHREDYSLLLEDIQDPCTEGFSNSLLEKIHSSQLTLFSWIRMGSAYECLSQKYPTLLKEMKEKIRFIGTKNFGWSIGAVMLLSTSERYAYHSPMVSWIQEENNLSRKIIPNSNFIDIQGLIGDSLGRLPLFTPEGKLMSLDKRHLTQSGAAFVGARLESVLERTDSISINN